jgi:hypothetical protein
MATIPNLQLRLDLHQFSLEFARQYALLEGCLKLVKRAAGEIRGSDNLKKILKVVLQFGSYMNTGNTKSVRGFKLNSLKQLWVASTLVTSTLVTISCVLFSLFMCCFLGSATALAMFCCVFCSLRTQISLLINMQLRFYINR